MPIANLRSLAIQRTPLRELNLNMLLGSPVMALPVQEGSGDYAYDISGFGNDGHLGGGVADRKPSWVQLPSGLWCLSFDGLDDYVDLGSNLSFADGEEWTAECWVKASGTPDIWATFGQLTPGNRFLFALGNQYWFKDVNSNEYYRTVGTLADIWADLVAVCNGSTIRFYYQGVDKGEVTPSSTEMSFLTFGDTADREWTGLASLLRVHNQAFSALDVQNQFNRAKHYFSIFDGNILARLLKQRTLAVLR